MHGGIGDDHRGEPQTLRGRTITRRVGLPSGRAVIGALLVTISVVGLFAAQQRSQRGPTTTFAVVTSTVPAGSVIEADDLRAMAMELPDDVAALTVADPASVVGHVAIETLRPGEVLVAAAVLDAADPAIAENQYFEFSMALDRSRTVDASLRPGELVDLVATVATDRGPCTAVVVDDARVVRSGTGSDDLLVGSGGDITITLAIVSPDDVLAAVHVIDEASVTVVRATRAQSARTDRVFCAADTLEERP